MDVQVMVPRAARIALVVFLFVLALNCVGLTAVILMQRSSYSQVSSDSLGAVLNRLKTQIDEDPQFLIAIQFVAPLAEGEDTVWTIPDRRANDDISIQISDIGDDYVCFDSLRGSARYTECTPFSNIVVIRYLQW